MRTGTLLFCSFLILSRACLSQNPDNVPNPGWPQNGVFTGGDIDTVQLNNGNLHIEIPLYSIKGRAGIAYRMSYVLDTQQWTAKISTVRSTGDIQALVRPVVTGTLQGKWIDHSTLNASARFSYAPFVVGQGCGGYYYNGYVTENGTKHHLVPDMGYPGNCVDTPTTGSYADDGSGWAYDLGTGQLLAANGGDATTQTDANGNEVWTTVNNISTDTLGRTFPPDGYYDSSGNAQSLTITTTSVPVSTNFCDAYYGDFGVSDGECYEATYALTMPYQIILPNGMTYTFTYVQNDDAEPESLTLPSGAKIEWTYVPGYTSGPVVASRKVTANGVTNTWNYRPTSCISTGASCTIDPLGNETDYTWINTMPNYANENKYYSAYNRSSLSVTKTYDKSSGTSVLVKTEQTDYSNSLGPVLPIRVTTTWNQANQVSKVETDYDSFTGPNTGVTVSASNPHERREYDFGSGGAGSLLRRTYYTYKHQSNSAYLNANIVDKVTSQVIYDNAANTCQGLSQPCAQTTYDYDTTAITDTSGLQVPNPVPNHDYTGHGHTFTVRGNLTQVSRWVYPGNTWLTTTNYYNDLGNLVQTTDPLGNSTYFDYTDNFTDGTNRNTLALVTKITRPSTGSVSHVQTSGYYWHTGQGAVACGENFTRACTLNYTLPQPDYTTFTYDAMLRPYTVTRGDTGSTTFSYNDSSLPLSKTTTTTLNSSQSVVAVTVFDDLFRTKQTQLDDPQGTIYTDVTYDALGRQSTVSNPYRTTSDPTYALTTYTFDALNRVTSVTEPDNSTHSSSATTQYCGAETMVTDEAGHWRRSRVDGLGRLVEVDEPSSTSSSVTVCPGTGESIWHTTYGYDTLDDLTSVSQAGSRVRSFTYDSLGRLTQANNPETGPVNYTYDSDSNLHTKTDNRSIMSTYTYDVLNRVTGVTYSNGDHAVGYTYDETSCLGLSTCHNGGRQTGMTDAGGSEAIAYDLMGRVGKEQRTTNSLTMSARYSYDLSDDLIQLWYPSGRILQYAYDSAGRPSSANDTSGVNYVTGSCANGVNNNGVCYAPQGVPSQMKNGTNLVSTYLFNQRLQPCWIYATTGTALATNTPCTSTLTAGNVLDLKYAYNPGSNNGNIQTLTNDRDTTRTQTFTYDQVNRIKTGQTTGTTGGMCWGESFTIDRYANLYGIAALSGYGACTQQSLSTSAPPNSNQLPGGNYDLAGNLTSYGANSYTWNGAGEMASESGTTYTYDGSGNRLQKSTGKIYWYGAGANALDESDLSGNFTNEYVYFGGRRIAMRNVSTQAVYYYEQDHLGSTRTILQAGQTSVCYDADFEPYGGEHVATNSCSQSYRYTGKERDSESTNDFFGARYYTSQMGRFVSPDPLGHWVADVNDPQSWNFYAYARNNPLSDFDPTGLDCVYFNDSGTGVESVDRTNHEESLNKQASDCGANGGNWVNGTAVSVVSDGQGDFSVRSSDENGTYTTAMTAPDSTNNPNGTCFGNCNYSYGFNPAAGYHLEDDIAPSSQVLIGDVASETRVVNKAGNCVALGVITGAGIEPHPNPEEGLFGFAKDTAIDKGVDKGGELAKKGAEKLAKFGGDVGKGAKVAGKVAGQAGHIFTAYQVYKAGKEEGCFSGWSQP